MNEYFERDKKYTVYRKQAFVLELEIFHWTRYTIDECPLGRGTISVSRSYDFNYLNEVKAWLDDYLSGRENNNPFMVVDQETQSVVFRTDYEKIYSGETVLK